MYYYISPSQEVTWNLALEEELFRNIQDLAPEGILLFYVNAPSLVVGRSQNLYQEVRWVQADLAGLPMCRRISGGGTVYHDLGNLNFSYILPGQRMERLGHFTFCLEGVEEYLLQLGLKVEMRPPSDLYVTSLRATETEYVTSLWEGGPEYVTSLQAGGPGGEKGPEILSEGKFSGNAQASGQRAFLQHGTLLYDSDLAVLDRYLHHIGPDLQTKGIASRRASVQNLKPFVEEAAQILPTTKSRLPLCFEDFRTGVEEALIQKSQAKPWPGPSQETQEAIASLVQSRYQSFAWNRGRQGTFSLTRTVPGLVSGVTELTARSAPGPGAGVDAGSTLGSAPGDEVHVEVVKGLIASWTSKAHPALNELLTGAPLQGQELIRRMGQGTGGPKDPTAYLTSIFG